MGRQAERLRLLPPRWDEDGLGCDMYYWYYGTYAMYQMGGRWWRTWNGSMKQALLTLSLQVYYRYTRLVGAR